VKYGIESEIRNKINELNWFLFKKFKVMFNRKANGTPRNWRIIKEEEIEQIFV